MRLLPLLIAATLAGCGDPVPADWNATEQNAVTAGPLVSEARPVRIGELGASFDACGAAGTTRAVKPGDSLAVRGAPFDTATETGRVPSGGRFFVCSRSLDQKWFGIVYADEAVPAERCGVSSPVPRRRDYDGPCRSGWVQSALVKLVSGVDLPAGGSAPAGGVESPPERNAAAGA